MGPGYHGFMLILLFGLFVSAVSPCSPVDVRPQLGAPRDQGQTGWCASHATADLVSQVLGYRVSAADLGTQHAIGDVQALQRSNDPGIRWYLQAHPDVLTRIALNRTLAKKSYTVPNLFTEKGLYDVGGSEDGILLLASLKGFCLDERLPSGADRYENYLLNIKRTYQSNMTDMSREAQKMVEHFSEWIDRRCGQRVPLRYPLLPDALYLANSYPEFEEKIRRGFFDRGSAHDLVFRHIDEALDHGRAASVSFNVNSLVPLEPGDDPNDGDHAAVIAARKMIGGRCHYFLRNSYGEDCGYRPGLKARCELKQGGVWLTDEEMLTAYASVWIH